MLCQTILAANEFIYVQVTQMPAMTPATRRSRAARCCAGRPSASARWRWRRCWPTSRAAERVAGQSARRRSRRTFPARAKRVIFLFMKGGPSHVDTFDPKPLLTRDDGKPLPFAKPRVQFAPTGNLLKSPWKFQQHGESGMSGQRAVPARRRARRRPVLDPLGARHQPGPRRGAAEAAHRQRQLRPPQHRLVGQLRPGDRERQPARLRHDLPDARPRRHQQLELGVSAGRLPGHAARQRQRPVGPGPREVHQQRRACRATCSGCNSTCWPR